MYEAEYLMAHGADPNVRNGLGMPLLMMAVLWEKPEPVAFLITHGADSYLTRDRSGSVPLFASNIKIRIEQGMDALGLARLLLARTKHKIKVNKDDLKMHDFSQVVASLERNLVLLKQAKKTNQAIVAMLQGERFATQHPKMHKIRQKIGRYCCC